jgi:hypothetical protein
MDKYFLIKAAFLLQPLLCNTSDDKTRKAATDALANQLSTIILAVLNNGEANSRRDVQTVKSEFVLNYFKKGI